MTGVRAVYHLGSNYGDETVTWEDGGALVDLDGFTITLQVFPFGGEVVFTKTNGLVIQPVVEDEPNLLVQWDGAADLDLLSPGTYVQFFHATDGTSTYVMFGELVIRENAPNAAYCEIDDLLLGDLELNPLVNKYTYLNMAADEINSRLGYIYTLPLTPAEGYDDVTETAMLVLKNINLKLASGRLLCAIATGGEEDSVHAYGASLIQEAWAELNLVLNGSLPLLGAELSGGAESTAYAKTYNTDATSGVDAFYEEFFGMHSQPFPISGGVWQPNE